MDLRGLAALFGKINSLLESREDGFGETDSLDLFGLSRFLHRRGEKDLAHSACAFALNAGLPAEFRPRATRELALMAKRCGDRERAASLLHELVANPQETVFACEQLAMHYERHTRDFARAVEFAQLGLKTSQRQFGSLRDSYASTRQRRIEEKFVCRLERLRHRIKSADGAPLLVRTTANSSDEHRAR
jgi:lipopolysaccharide biosynthesis regulator YciM